MKEYVIHVTKTDSPKLDGTWGVGFSVDTTHPSGKEVTFCMIRNEVWFEPYAGCSVKNPNDFPDQKGYDPRKGEQTAFKRSIESLLDGVWTGAKEKKFIIDRFRGALWIAMGRPGYAKPDAAHKIIAKKLITNFKHEMNCVSINDEG